VAPLVRELLAGEARHAPGRELHQKRARLFADPGRKEHPQNRVEAARPAYEELGVTIREGFMAFGDYDVVLLIEAPDNVRAAAISLAVSAGGAVSDYKTTPLMTWDEGVEAMRIAGESSYTPPQ
jgi:uncharacterized protein with GYD domain